MSDITYTPYYPGGWKHGEEGSTPITPEALTHFDTALQKQAGAIAQSLPMPAGTAQAGQFLQVSAVDDTGKVTATQAVTIAVYGGETEEVPVK